MAFEVRTEQMVCRSCGAGHNLKWSRMPVRERATVKCKGCDSVLFAGNTVRDYYEVNLIDNT